MSESQYAGYSKFPCSQLGLRANVWYEQDPRGLLFHLARYKFVAKMLSGKENVLEIGCGDCTGTRLVQQEVKYVTAIDFDPAFVMDAIERESLLWPLEIFVHDILRGPVTQPGGRLFQAAYALDVLEHIDPQDETLFMANVCASIVPEGVLILGTPSAQSQAYASDGSRAGHVNCKTGAELRGIMLEHFGNVFLFGMNDETLHTGYLPMCQYLFALGVGVL